MFKSTTALTIAMVVALTTSHARLNGNIVATITDVQTHGPNTVGGVNPGGGCFYVYINPTMGETIDAAEFAFDFTTNIGSVGDASAASLIPNWQEFTDSFTTPTLDYTAADLTGTNSITSPVHFLRVDFDFADFAVTPTMLDIAISGQLGESPSTVHSTTFQGVAAHMVDVQTPFQTFQCGPPTPIMVPEPSAFLFLGAVSMVGLLLVRLRKS